MIEDNPADAHLMMVLLEVSGADHFKVEKVVRLCEGLERIAEGGVDVVLLDLELPDSIGLETFTRLKAEAPEMPVVVLTGLEDETVAQEAVKLGAQDYLPKSEMSGSFLVRSLLFALERSRMLRQLVDARAEVERLRAMLPLCGDCYRVRDDGAYFARVRSYMEQCSDASTGRCETCEGADD